MFVTVLALKYALLSDQMDIFKLIQFYLNNTMNLRHLGLTQRIMSCYTYKMAIVS